MSNGINSLGETEKLRQFGKFTLDPHRKILWRGENAVALPLKAVEILCVLIERNGNLVTKDEILNAVWKKTVVEESNLTNNISHLRKAFREHNEENFIETFPSRGYRFVGKVADIYECEEVVIERHSISQAIIEQSCESPEKVLQLPASPNEQRLKLKHAAIALASILIAITGVFAFWSWNKPSKATGLADLKSLAVLPFRSFGETAVDENLGLRMMDSLITKLGKIETISVRPTSSTMNFLGSDENPLEIGKKLLVDAILEGSIQRERNTIRVTLQLVSVKSGEQLWSEQFDGEADKLLDLQNAVSTKLIDKLHLPLSSEQQLDFVRRPTTNSEAYEEYLKGRYFWNKRTPESLKSAIAAFEKAIKLDANFADAYVGLADSHYLLFDYSYNTSPNNVEFAKVNISKAIELNPALPEAYTTLGSIRTTVEWNWNDAEISFLKAIEISPNSPNAHHRYGMLLMKLRRFAEAENELLKAKSLDPTSPAINKNLGVVFFFAKRSDEAIIQLYKSLDLDHDFVGPRWYLARCSWLKNEKKEALLEYAKAIEIEGDKDLAAKIMNDANSVDPNIGIQNLLQEWRKQVNKTGVSYTDLAILASYLEDKSSTLNWLEKAVAARHPWATWINAEPEFDFIRDEPRFQALLKKMNFQ